MCRVACFFSNHITDHHWWCKVEPENLNKVDQPCFSPYLESQDMEKNQQWLESLEFKFQITIHVDKKFMNILHLRTRLETAAHSQCLHSWWPCLWGFVWEFSKRDTISINFPITDLAKVNKIHHLHACLLVNDSQRPEFFGHWSSPSPAPQARTWIN